MAPNILARNFTPEPPNQVWAGDITYKWKKRYHGCEVSDLRKLKALEEENRRLKKLVVDKELDIDAMKALLEKYEHAR